jgi:hypothetical protein
MGIIIYGLAATVERNDYEGGETDEGERDGSFLMLLLLLLHLLHLLHLLPLEHFHLRLNTDWLHVDKNIGGPAAAAAAARKAAQRTEKKRTTFCCCCCCWIAMYCSAWAWA